MKYFLLPFMATLLMAGGYKIPDQSNNGIALSSAYVANANGADANYYNPANIVSEDESFEIGMRYIHLSNVKFRGSSMLGTSANGQTLQENAFIPYFHYVSKSKDNWNWGLSLVTPLGLAKRWNDPYQKTLAQEFRLQTIELNPTIAYKLAQNLSVGFGVRKIYSKGFVKSDGLITLDGTSFHTVAREVKGDCSEYGYNLALSYKPTKDLKLSSTYRSNINLVKKGDAQLYYDGNKDYDGNVEVSIPLPASLAIAIAYDFGDTSFEFVFDRTYWSSYKNLDFNYDTINNPTLTALFDTPVGKNWKDANAYRLGITHRFNSKIVGMLGYTKDKNPVPNDTLSFELPDSDANQYSTGLQYKYNQNTNIGIAFMYVEKDDRVLDNEFGNGVFTNTKAYFTNIAFNYRF